MFFRIYKLWYSILQLEAGIQVTVLTYFTNKVLLKISCALSFVRHILQFPCSHYTPYPPSSRLAIWRATKIGPAIQFISSFWTSPARWSNLYPISAKKKRKKKVLLWWKMAQDTPKALKKSLCRKGSLLAKWNGISSTPLNSSIQEQIIDTYIFALRKFYSNREFHNLLS